MSGHALLSPSAAGRWLNCTPVPRLEESLPESVSEYAEEGRLAHSVCELAAKKKFSAMPARTYSAALKKLKANPLWQDEMLSCAAEYVEHLEEHAMLFPSAPYVALEVKVDISDYARDAFGTCDSVIIGGDQLIVTDYKHGKGVMVSAQENPQMLLYALGALKLYKPVFGDSLKRITVCIDQPRLNHYDVYSLTEAELLAWGENVVKPKAALAYMGLGAFNPGEWCRFCRMKAQCRARADAHTALEDFKDALLPTPENTKTAAIEDKHGVPHPPLLTDTEIGGLLSRGEALVAWYNSLKEYALNALLNGGEIPGWKAVEGRSSRAWADQDKAIETIINAGYPRELVYDSVIKSLAQLEKLIGTERFNGLVGSLIVKPAGKPALAPESDKRPAYSSAAADFEGAGDLPF